MIKHKSLPVICIILLTFSILSSGKYSFDFLEYGVGTRAKALGGSFVSIADDGSSLLWNPAGTARLTSSRFYFMHNAKFSGMSSMDYVSFIKPIISKSFFAIAITRHTVGDIPIFPELSGTREERDTTPEIQGDGVPRGYFGETATIYLINLSKSIKPGSFDISVGTNFKYYDETIYGYSGTGIGIDFGGIFSLMVPHIPGYVTLGLNLQDATGTQILWNTSSRRKDIIPTNYRFGINYSKTFDKIASTFLITFDYNTRYGGSKHTGIEYIYRDNFLVDVGFNDSAYSFGMGFKFWKIGIQYGFIPHTLGSSHSLSMELTL